MTRSYPNDSVPAPAARRARDPRSAAAGQREAPGVEHVALGGGQLEADGGALGGRGAVELGEHAAAVVLLAVEVEDRVVAEVLDQLDRGGQRGGAGGEDADVLGADADGDGV